jgi:hypothetical protein
MESAQHPPLDELEEEAEEEINDPELLYYNREKRPQKICPFSDPTRTHPCTSHDQPRKRKDAITNHLTKLHNWGGNE